MTREKVSMASSDRSLRYVSLFSGVEAASLAWEPLGWKPMAFCEVNEFPAAVLAHRYPDVPNLGDVCKVDWKEFVNEHGRPDVLAGGSPCFPAGTLVLCEGGYKPIELVEVGDMVVTHKGRLRRVLKTGCKTSNIGTLKVHGMMPISCTPNHPILASTKTKQDKDENGCWWRFSDESFVRADKTKGMVACQVLNIDCEIPEIPDVYGLERPDIMELVGWYLGDDSIVKKGKRNPTLRTLELSINPKKLVSFVATFKQRLNYRVESIDGTRCRILIHNTAFCNFLERWFGRRAENKNLPAWVFALPMSERKRLFDGYAKTDDHLGKNGWTRIDSVSKALIVGMHQLIGFGSTCATKPRGVKVIRGVEYQTKPIYALSANEEGRSGWLHNGYTKRSVISFTPMNTVTLVYNLEVEGDNSYTADGIAVHNCQSFSVSGRRESLGGESRLMFEYVRACAEIRSPWIVWENVPGVFSVRDNAFAQLLCSLQDVGYVSLAWRVLDAQFFGVAQRRRRVFLVGRLGDGGVPQRYSLSPRAYEGILRRAERRGKPLPPMLLDALEAQARAE